ncbi:hypothetical protein KY339_03290 [Candidatus Woesearchaeota archaeon]|nr:hypothetical protein [Candidatus Woesearchaeota archaeon]
MSFIEDIAAFFNNFKFYEVVHEFQQGLHFRKGIVLARKIKYHGSELEEILKQEKEVTKECGGKSKFILPFSRPELPEGYKRSFITGMPRHPKRYKRSKVLRAGLYFNIPLLDDIIVEDKQERVVNLGYIGVPTIDEGDESEVLFISCNIRYEIKDYYKAHVAVSDYDQTIQDHALSVLAVHSRGRKYDDWKDSKVIQEIENKVVEELRKIATEKWGLKIHRVYITDHVSCNMQRVAYEGQPLLIHNKEAEEE